MSVTEDKLLWDSVVKGDQRAFTELFERYWESFFQYTYRILQNREETEELVQELFIYIWNKRTDFPELQSVQAYLFTMLKNRILNLVAKNRALRRRVGIVTQETPQFEHAGASLTGAALTGEGESGFAGAFERKSSEGLIRNMASSLPEKMQQVYLMHQFSDLSIAEIATATGNSEQTIRNQYNTALKKLGVLYKNHFRYFSCFILIFSGLEWLPFF